MINVSVKRVIFRGDFPLASYYCSLPHDNSYLSSISSQNMDILPSDFTQYAERKLHLMTKTKFFTYASEVTLLITI